MSILKKIRAHLKKEIPEPAPHINPRPANVPIRPIEENIFLENEMRARIRNYTLRSEAAAEKEKPHNGYQLPRIPENYDLQRLQQMQNTMNVLWMMHQMHNQ